MFREQSAQQFELLIQQHAATIGSLEKLRESVKNERVISILAQGSAVICARLDALMKFSTLIGQIHDHLASAMPTQYVLVQEEKPKARLLVLSVKTFEGKEVKSLIYGLKKWKWP